MTADDPAETTRYAAAAIGPGWVVVAPTFNHATALGMVLQSLACYGLPVIVVNDGATDQTSQILAGWMQAGNAGAPRRVIEHEANRGKAAALRSGFVEAARLGYTHAITIDTDGQHDAADLAALMAVSSQCSDAIVIGARTRVEAGTAAPLASRIGRVFSNTMVWIESGVRVTDSQSGMRIYPLVHMNAIVGHASRYGFETEVISRAGWHRVPVRETPIRCIYQPQGGRTTHFRIGWDTLAAIIMHAGLFHRALLPGPSRVCATGDPQTGTLPRRLARWFSPRVIWEMAHGDIASRERLAASVGVGLLMATLPVYGVKTVVCLWLAGRFRLHPLAVISVSSLSTPPLGFGFIGLSIGVGAVLLHGRLPELAAIDFHAAAQWSTVNSFLAEWLVGSVIAGSALGLIGYALMRLLLRRPANRLRPVDCEMSGERV